jgi:hypothetical protein
VVALSVLALALMLSPVVRTAPAEAKATTVTTNEKIPLDMPVFVPCANGGVGEVVWLSGTLHLLSHATDDGSGGFHVSIHSQPQGVSGVGLDTGDKYQGTGVTREDRNAKPPFPSESTYVNNFRIIGQGPGNNLLIHENVHMTVSANGEVTAEVDNFKAECT